MELYLATVKKLHKNQLCISFGKLNRDQLDRDAISGPQEEEMKNIE